MFGGATLGVVGSVATHKFWENRDDSYGWKTKDSYARKLSSKIIAIGAAVNAIILVRSTLTYMGYKLNKKANQMIAENKSK
ncbi:MAG: hypothetical protein UR26_C0001G0067 [candidate division TM6 bacterium GW2011_GWF2_32_72]|nr:MAG: hypothetical protein UR26_C0001G0067 [candidate division TM6 bacterium GW2011_GWF2_32_72]